MAARAAVKSAKIQTETLPEIVIKNCLGRSDFEVNPRELRQTLLDNDFNELSVFAEHALAVESLPLLHKDPFDRLLVAQATVESSVLLTVDRTLARYPGPIRAL